MRKVSEYRQHAQECRELAAQMAQADRREQLLKMAAVWDELADDRERTQGRDALEPKRH